MCENNVNLLNPTMLFCIKGERNFKEKPHSHNHIEIAYIISGKSIFNIDDKQYEVKEGDLVIINPYQNHSGLITEPENPSVEFFIGFTDFQFENMEKNTLFKNYYPVISTSPSTRKYFLNLIDAIIHENSQNKFGKYFMLKTYLVQFILLVVREKNNEIDFSNETAKAKVSKEISEYFHKHYSEKISLEQIAKNMYLSPFYISKIFKEEIGDTPINYLIKIRLEHAKELLLNHQNLNIKQISSIVGYEDAYYFSKLFKKYYGASPAEFKKINHK